MPADGRTLEPKTLLTEPNQQVPYGWSPDGRELLYYEASSTTRNDIWALRTDETSEPRVIVQTEYNERHPVLSSDGRWLAYTSNVTGRGEIWARSYDGEGAPVRVSANGGREARWAPGDRELYFLEEDRVMAVSVQTEPGLQFGPPQLLFDGIFRTGSSAGFYDVAPDGTFIVIKTVSDTAEGGSDPGDLVAVVNWFEELKARVPTTQ